MRTDRLSFAVCRFVRFPLIAILLAGCSIGIDWPKNDGDVICPPVQIVVNSTGGMSGFAATLDGVNVTSQFFTANGRASAQLNAAPGSHTLVVSGVFPGASSIQTLTATRLFEVPALRLSASPASINLSPNGSAASTITASGCGGAVAISLVPASGVSVNPATFTLNIPASSNPGISGGTSAAGNTTTHATAASGQFIVSVSGASAGQTASTTLTANVAGTVVAPTVSGATPAMLNKGDTLTVTGTGFSPACANNTVTIGGVNVTPTVCTPAGNSLSFAVPAQVSYGATHANVTVAGATSSPGAPVTIARRAGAFTVTDVIATRTNRTCVNENGSTGNRNVQFSQISSNAYRASYSGSAGAIGSVDFAVDYVGQPATVFNAGGGGFSLCTAAVVLDAGWMRLHLINLDSGAHPQAYQFTFYAINSATPTYVTPIVERSVDGSLILFATAGGTTLQQVAFIDMDKGHFAHVIATPTACASFLQASISLTNTIELQCASTTGNPTTTSIPIL
jgi:IPT/TIG domain-containing protein